MSASYVATPVTSIDAATVQLRMVGKLTDYTAAQLDAIKVDLGAAAGISPSTITLDPVSAGADTVLSATMPAASAAEVVAKYAAKSFTTLGAQQVRHARLPDVSVRLRSDSAFSLTRHAPVRYRF